ncbi:putative nucleic acid-binding, replication factor A [Helianthus annuus]|nr:putative nucleic acid-binding, replication factor A [Helianthus annuus]KAJ0607212.1 putative nucleic acid-binding, replication factor A [Helianthus annuus]KAJ0767270.1 putative nucleic acid-binding, replication factor A [Helianthus annuus]
MALADLREGSTGPITVMVCRKWDVTSVNGRYMSTDYVVSDKKGGVMHCTARNNIAHYFFDKLKEGGIYLLKGFTVLNTDQYRILKDSPFVIGLNGSTIVKKVDDASGSFTRYPFLLTAFEDLQPTEGKFFVGYVTEVGPQSVKASGARTVEFNLTNERKRGVRVTLWGQLGDAMLKKKEQNPAVYSIILTSMSAKFHLGALGLSSSSSTMIIDSPEVPALQTFKTSISYVAVGDTSDPITEDVVCVGTLQELVDRVRADKSKKKVILFRNVVEITSIRTKNSWYLFACSGSKCRKGLTREAGYFICKACESKVDYPRTRFRIQADVTDGTMSTVVVLFDEAAEQLVKRTARSLVEEQLKDTSIDAPILPFALAALIGTKHTFEIKSHTYYHFGDYESFTCAKIVGPDMDDADKSVDTVANGLGATPSGSLKRGSNLSPLTPVTGRKLRKFCVEDSHEDDDGVRVDRKDVTDVLDDGRDDQEGSC